MRNIALQNLNRHWLQRWLGALGTCLLLVGLFADLSFAQPVALQNNMRGDMAPGAAADLARMRDPSLDSHMQPVRVIAPDGTRLEIGVDEGFIHVNSSRVSLGMFVGPVYRLKVTNIAQHWDKSLYPSIEILGKLNPPEELKNEFPIQVVVSQDDLEQAIGGNMVTKVIYLEDPNNAVPQKHLANEQPFFDVGSSTDPMSAARQLGRPVAILRIGSRIPMSTDRADFNFRSPEPQLLPEPQMRAPNPKWEEPVEFQPLRMPQLRPLGNPSTQPRGLPPIVPGEIVPLDQSSGAGQIPSVNLNDQSMLLPGHSILRKYR